MSQTNAQRTALVRDAIIKMAPKTESEAEKQTWQSINSILERVKAELAPQGFRVNRNHVQTRLNKLKSEGKAESRLVDKPQNESQKGRKNHLLFLLLPQGNNAHESQVVELPEEVRPKKSRTRRSRATPHSTARAINDFLSRSLPK